MTVFLVLFDLRGNGSFNSHFLHYSRKDRMRKREERLQRRMATLDRSQVLVGVEPSSTMSSSSAHTNPNWYLVEKSQEESARSSPGTLTRVTGNEPFVVGRSLARYSKELDNSRPSSANRYGRSQSSSEFEWRRGSLPLQPTRIEGVNSAEERMARLGMIPPRSHDAAGHFPMGYMTAPHPRKNVPMKYVPRRSDGDVLIPVKEVELWDSSSPPPFPISKEDYNTEGVTWYRSKSLDGDNLISSSVSYSYPINGPQAHQSQNGRVVSNSNLFPSAASAVQEYHPAQEPEKLKRIQRVGVPTLPE